MKGGKIFQEYLDLQEAYYLSYLVSDPLAAYMKQRTEEADRLQRVASPMSLQQKSKSFSRTGTCMKWLRKSGNYLEQSLPWPTMPFGIIGPSDLQIMKTYLRIVT